MNINAAAEATTPKSRLLAMTQGLLKDSAIPAAIRPMVANMVKQYFDKVNDSDIESLIVELARDVIPFILGCDLESFIERLSTTE